jgi:peroxiredoxin Q/BCP
VAVLGVSVDDEAKNRAFAEKYDFPFPLLCDTDRAVSLAYGTVDRADDAYARRWTFVIDGEGKIEQAIETQRPADQAGELLKDLGLG